MGEPRSGTGAKLSEFVREYMQRTGVTNLSLARRSVDHETGQELLPQWVRHLIENRIPRSPELWRYRALATGMGIDVEVIQRLAAAQWIGVELVEEAPGEWVTVEVPVTLTAAERRIVRETAANLARQMVEGRTKAVNGE